MATLVLAVLRHARAEDPTLIEQEESVRSQWAALGVLVNELARPALFLNLPGHDSCPGEPSYLSLRALFGKTHHWAMAQCDVFVCENPNIVTLAADALGASCAPLVCTDGMPAAAQKTLLAQLHAAGAQLHYHGDFDWAGIAIANVVLRKFRAVPWRFGADDYLAAIRTCTPSKRRLDATGRIASWDDGLNDVMLACGVPIDEEAVIGMLLQDLETH